jgi:hypothetical protein
MNTNKDALNRAQGLKFDRDKHAWIPENKSKG